MTSKSKSPSADADINELHAWAAGPHNPTPGRPRTTSSSSTKRDVSLLAKALLVVAAGLAAYLVFSLIIGLLITLLMIAGGLGLLYAVFRLGRWRGRQDD